MESVNFTPRERGLADRPPWALVGSALTSRQHSFPHFRPMRLLLLPFLLPAVMYTLAAQPTSLLRTNRGTPMLDGYRDSLYQRKSQLPFTVSAPVFGQLSPHENTVSVAYDESALYVYAELSYASTTPTSARKTFRDNRAEVDYFAVWLDPYRSGTSAYRFGVTAAGTRFDQGPNGFDGVWTHARRETATGWAVELRIPLFNIPHPDRSEQVWALNFERYVLADNETSYWHPVDPRRGSRFRQMGELAHLHFVTRPHYIHGAINAGTTAQRAVKRSGIRGRYGGSLATRVGLGRAWRLQAHYRPDPQRIYRRGPSAFNWDADVPLLSEVAHLRHQPHLLFGNSYVRPVNYGAAQRQHLLRQRFGTAATIVQNRQSLIHQIQLGGRGASGWGLGLTHRIYQRENNFVFLEDRLVHQASTRPRLHHSELQLGKLLPHNGYLAFQTNRVFHPDSERDQRQLGVQYQQADNSDTYQWSIRADDQRIPDTNILDNEYRLSYLDASFADIRGPWRWSVRYHQSRQRYIATDSLVESLQTARQWVSQRIERLHFPTAGPFIRSLVGGRLDWQQRSPTGNLYATPAVYARLLDAGQRSYRVDASGHWNWQSLTLGYRSDPRRSFRWSGSFMVRRQIQDGALPNLHHYGLRWKGSLRLTDYWYLNGHLVMLRDQPSLSSLAPAIAGRVDRLEALERRQPEVDVSIQFTPHSDWTVGAAYGYRYTLQRALLAYERGESGAFFVSAAAPSAPVESYRCYWKLGSRWRATPGSEIRFQYSYNKDIITVNPVTGNARHQWHLGIYWWLGPPQSTAARARRSEHGPGAVGNRRKR